MLATEILASLVKQDVERDCNGNDDQKDGCPSVGFPLNFKMPTGRERDTLVHVIDLETWCACTRDAWGAQSRVACGFTHTRASEDALIVPVQNAEPSM